jgi:undecaprenyl-diphosphatase
MTAHPRIRRLSKGLRVVIERLGPRLALGLAAAGLVFGLFVLLAREVGKGDTQRFDDAVRYTVRGVASPRLTGVLRWVTSLGSSLALVPATLVAAAIFVRRRRNRAAILLVVTMAGVTLLNWLLKVLFQRGRPVPFFDLPLPSSYSFPSGHALASFCFYASLAALLTARTRRAGLRLAIWTSAALVIAAVGFSRIYLGVHYASDVAAGYGAGFVWVLTVASGDRMLRRVDRARSKAAIAEPPVKAAPKSG